MKENIESNINQIETESNVEDGTLEQIAHSDSDNTERKRIEIEKGRPIKNIMEEYGVSKNTAWRARNRGWLFLNYLKRVIDIDQEWISKNQDRVEEASKSGARMAATALHVPINKIGFFDFEDVVSAAKQRIVELSGHPKRDANGFMEIVGRNAASRFIRDIYLDHESGMDRKADNDFSRIPNQELSEKHDGDEE